MSYFDQLMALSGMFFCYECGGFHAPIAPAFGPPGVGGGFPGGDSPFPSPTFPPFGGGFPGMGGGYPDGFGQSPFPAPTPMRDPWGGIDPYDGAIEVNGPDDPTPVFQRPPADPVWSPPPPSPAPPTARPAPRPPAPRPRPPAPPRGGGYNDDDFPIDVSLPPIRPGKKHQPLDPNDSFLNPSVLRGVTEHPYNPSYPRQASSAPPPPSTLTREQASARAFVETFLTLCPITTMCEDMYMMWRRGRLSPKLVEHFKYLVAVVIPYLQAGGVATPGDYCKIRRCIDWAAEECGVFGPAITWDMGFGKGGGHSRETGWWRKERDGYKESGEFSSDMM